jgi:hypothetical protein
MSYQFFLYLAVGQVVYENGEIYPNCARFFVRKKYTTFNTERIVALQSVNKIFPESYDFAAKLYDIQYNIISSRNAQLVHQNW